MSRARGYTLIELLVVIMVAAIAASLVIPASLRARRNARITRCSARLGSLGKQARAWVAAKGGGPAETGPAFWIKVAPAGTPLSCPVKGGSPAGGCDYRGPALPWDKAVETDIVGADAAANHSGGGDPVGGAILRKGGEVQVVADNETLWEQASRQTR